MNKRPAGPHAQHPILLAVLVLFCFGAVATLYFPAAGLFCLAAAFTLGCGWIFYLFFVRSQSRVIEWMAASIVTGALMLVVRTWWERTGDDSSHGKSLLNFCTGAAGVLMLLLSGLGWFVISHRTNQTPARRFWTLAAFWSGAAGMTVFICLLAFGAKKHPDSAYIVVGAFALCVPPVYTWGKSAQEKLTGIENASRETLSQEIASAPTTANEPAPTVIPASSVKEREESGLH